MDEGRGTPPWKCLPRPRSGWGQRHKRFCRSGRSREARLTDTQRLEPWMEPQVQGRARGEQAVQRPLRHFQGSLQPGVGSAKEPSGALVVFRTQKTALGPSGCLPPLETPLAPPSFCPGSWTRSPEPECGSRLPPASPHPTPSSSLSPLAPPPPSTPTRLPPRARPL